jgi:hypothetical protein
LRLVLAFAGDLNTALEAQRVCRAWRTAIDHPRYVRRCRCATVKLSPRTSTSLLT